MEVGVRWIIASLGAIVSFLCLKLIGFPNSLSLFASLGLFLSIGIGIMAMFSRLAIFGIIAWSVGILASILPRAQIPNNYVDVILKQQSPIYNKSWSTVSDSQKANNKPVPITQKLDANLSTNSQIAVISSDVAGKFYAIKALEKVCNQGNIKSSDCEKIREELLK